MTAVQKARELVKTFLEDDFIMKDTAKKCALVTVEALIKEHTWKNPISWNLERRAYWAEVKQEIEKL